MPPLPFRTRFIQLQQPAFINFLSSHTAAEFSNGLPVLD
jgi:hypothetical protein